MKHRNEWVAQPEMPNKYLLVNIMEGALTTTRYSFLLANPPTASKRWPNVVLILCLWRISWHFLSLEALATLHLAPRCLVEFPVQLLPSRASYSPERESFFFPPNEHADRERIKETSRNHPARGLE